MVGGGSLLLGCSSLGAAGVQSDDEKGGNLRKTGKLHGVIRGSRNLLELDNSYVQYDKTSDGTSDGNTKKNAHAGEDVMNAFEAISVGKYQVNAMLMRPTDESMTVSVMGFEPMTVFIKYGEDPSSLEYQTGLYTLEETEPQNLVIDGLKPDTKYYYTVYCQEAIDAGMDKSTLEHFRTQRSPGQTFKFTITADSHYAEQPQFGDGRLWQNTLANVGAADPDFHVDLGDTYMSNKHVWNVPGADMSTVDLLHQGQRKYFGGALASVPFFKIQGNQDGEFGYHRVSAKGQPPVALWAARARTKYFPQPNPGQAFYTGNAKAEADVGGFVENYYAWRWGDALLVTLDPYFHTPMQAS